MPHGAPPPPPAPATDATQLPDPRPASQVGVLVAALAAGASVPIPGIREDYGIVEAIVGTDVAASLTLDYVPLRTPASSSLYLPFDEPVITGTAHTITNTSAGVVNLSLYAVAKRRINANDDTAPRQPGQEDDEG